MHTPVLASRARHKATGVGWRRAPNPGWARASGCEQCSLLFVGDAEVAKFFEPHDICPTSGGESGTGNLMWAAGDVSTPAICQGDRGRQRLRKCTIWSAPPKKPPVSTAAHPGANQLTATANFAPLLERPLLDDGLERGTQFLHTAMFTAICAHGTKGVDGTRVRSVLFATRLSSCRALPRKCNSYPLLQRPWNSSVFSKQPQAASNTFSSESSAENSPGYLPLTALGATAGGTTIQQTSRHGDVFSTILTTCPLTEGSLSRSCLGPTQNNTPNAKLELSKLATEVR